MIDSFYPFPPLVGQTLSRRGLFFVFRILENLAVDAVSNSPTASRP